MTDLKNITDFLDKYLDIQGIADDSWNGLQVEGAAKVSKIALAVDAGQDTFQKAVDAGAELLIVHHGHFWRSGNPSVISWQKARLSILFKNNISLYAAHLPLDLHPEVGNNIQLLKLLGAEPEADFIVRDGKSLSKIGKVTTSLSIQEVEQILTEKIGSKCITLAFGRQEINKIAVCTGSGGYGAIYEAAAKGADLYITGDTAEIYQTAKDMEINVIFAGHYATETLGLKALSPVLERELAIPTIFLESPTGL